MLRIHRAGKGPGDCGGWGLGSTEQKGSRRALHPWSQRAGDLTWEPSRLPGLEWAGQTPSSPLLLFQCLQEGSSCLPLLFFPQPPSHAPRTHAAWRGLWRAGLAWEPSRLPRPEWARRSPSAPLPLLPEGPSCLPLLISPASVVPILFGFHFSSPLSPPMSYRFTWGFLPSLWASGSPISGWQAP